MFSFNLLYTFSYYKVKLMTFCLSCNCLSNSERRSHITGRSVHNQRIERLWRDLWCVVVANYYSAFRHLEEVGALDPDNDVHLICLHYVMLARLNWHLQMFTQTWDGHPLASEGNKSPQQLWVAGQLVGPQQIPDQVYICF